MFYHITGIASLPYTATVLVNNNNFINNGSTILFCTIWNDCLQFLVFVSRLIRTITRRTIRWVRHSNTGKGEMSTKCWLGKWMKRPFWKYTRKYRCNIVIDLQLIMNVCMCVHVCVWVTDLELSNSRLGSVTDTAYSLTKLRVGRISWNT
jgi:hypothetical protein